MRQADGHQHMARVERTGRAGRASRTAYAHVIQHQDQTLALDRLKHERRCARQAVYRVASEVRIRYLVHHALDQFVRQYFDVTHLFVQTFDRFLHRGRKADAARGVFRARAPAALLSAAINQRLERDALFHVQRAYAARAAELVRGQRKHVDAHLLHVDVHMADRLHGIRVELCADRMGERGDLLQRLDGADLVVRGHDGDKRGVLRELLFQLFEVDMAFLIHVQIGDAEAFLFECFAGVQHRVMLNFGGDQVLAAFGRRAVHKAADGEVVRLRTAAGEDDLAGGVVVGLVDRHCRVQALADRRARLIECHLGLAADAVERGRVAEMLGQPRFHRVERRFGQRGGRRVVRVNKSFHVFISAFLVKGVAQSAVFPAKNTGFPVLLIYTLNAHFSKRKADKLHAPKGCVLHHFVHFV